MIEHHRNIRARIQGYHVIREAGVNVFAGTDISDGHIAGGIQGGNVRSVGSFIPGDLKIDMVGREGMAGRVKVAQGYYIVYFIDIQRGNGEYRLDVTTG